MQWKNEYINDEDQGVQVWLPNGECIEITFDGSDPVVTVILFDGTRVPTNLEG